MRWETTGTTFAQTFKQIFADYFIHVAGTIHVHNVQIFASYLLGSFEILHSLHELASDMHMLHIYCMST